MDAPFTMRPPDRRGQYLSAADDTPPEINSPGSENPRLSGTRNPRRAVGGSGLEYAAGGETRFRFGMAGHGRVAAAAMAAKSDEPAVPGGFPGRQTWGREGGEVVYGDARAGCTKDAVDSAATDAGHGPSARVSPRTVGKNGAPRRRRVASRWRCPPFGHRGRLLEEMIIGEVGHGVLVSFPAAGGRPEQCPPAVRLERPDMQRLVGGQADYS